MKLLQRFHRSDTAHQYKAMTLLTLFCILILIVVTSIMYINVIMHKNSIYIDKIMEQYNSYIDEYVREAEYFAQTLAYESVVSQFLLEDDPARRYDLSRQLSSFLSNLKTIQPYIADVFLFPSNDSNSRFLTIAENQERILSRVREQRLPVPIGFFPYSTATSESTMLFVGCSIYDISDIGHMHQPIGSLVLAMSLDRMGTDFQELFKIPGINYAMLNEDMQMIRGTTDQINDKLSKKAFSLLQNHDSAKVQSFMSTLTVKPVLDAHGYLLVRTNPSVILSDMIRATIVVLALTVLIYLLNLYFYRIVKRSIALPITNLTRELSKGHTNQQFPLEGNSDVQSLTETLNHLFSTKKTLSETLDITNTRLREAELSRIRIELQFLRSQINPHFIYNTLETIRSISAIHKLPEVGQIAKSLATIMRYSIKGKESVPLREELDIIHCYLSIQSIRFGDRLTYDFNLSEGVEDLLIPRMCLQPIIENAVIHGLETKIKDGHLALHAYTENKNLVIQIKDNGAGLSPERLETLNKILSNPNEYENAEQGIGLINVMRRIHIYSSDEYGFTLSSTTGEGTCVTIKLPIVKEQ